MIHGLASSPEAWVNVANELLRDDEIRRDFQVWQFYYPTNMPIAMSHDAMRHTLAEVFKHRPAARRRPRMTWCWWGTAWAGSSHG